jgi:hypothetical protein
MQCIERHFMRELSGIFPTLREFKDEDILELVKPKGKKEDEKRRVKTELGKKQKAYVELSKLSLSR